MLQTSIIFIIIPPPPPIIRILSTFGNVGVGGSHKLSPCIVHIYIMHIVCVKRVKYLGVRVGLDKKMCLAKIQINLIMTDNLQSHN